MVASVNLEDAAGKSWHFSDIHRKSPGQDGYELFDPGALDLRKVFEIYSKTPIPGLEIKRVTVIHNPDLNRKFAAQLKLLNARHGNPAFAPTYTQEPYKETRKEIIAWQHQQSAPYQDPDAPHVQVQPVWHGMPEGVFPSVCETGYANLATTDDGFFGKGLYNTYEPRYAYECYATKHGTRRGTLVFNWVATYSSYPVVDGDMGKLIGRGNYKNYDAHLVPVKPRTNNPKEMNYFPLKPNERATYHELVVFDNASCLPRYKVDVGAPDGPQPGLLPKTAKHESSESDPVEGGNAKTPTSPISVASMALANLMKGSIKEPSKPAPKPLPRPASKPPKPTDSDNGVAMQQLANIMKGSINAKGSIKGPSKPAPKPLPRPASKPPKHANSVKDSSAKLAPVAPQQPGASAYVTGSFKADLEQAMLASVQLASQGPPKTAPPPIFPWQKDFTPFKAEDWKLYFGDVGEEPPLPDDIDAILASPCPFSQGKSVLETHVLTLIPATVNGKPFCLNFLGELIKKPLKGHPTEYKHYLQALKEQEGAKSPNSSFWSLMSRHSGPNVQTQHPEEYAVPGVLEVATAILMWHVANGDKYIPSTLHMRCQEKLGNLQAIVGGFSSCGLHIDFSSNSETVALSRKFYAP